MSIPIWNEFIEYLIYDLKYFKAKSILLQENGNPIGNCLIFDVGEDTLYFGYFGILNHNKENIQILIDELIKYAKRKNFKRIFGPINIPAIIFGWGFMKEGSLESLFIGKPVNPPIYQNIFINNGFNVKYEELSFVVSPIPKFNPWKMKRYDFSDYEYFNPKDLDEFLQYKDEFLILHKKFLPPSARITPNISDLIENYARFLFKFGYNTMIFFVKHKPTNSIVACGSFLPNPFRKNNGVYDSCVGFTWVVDPKHRRNGLTRLMWGATSLLLAEKGVDYCSIPVAADNETNLKTGDILNAVKSRTHLILELIL